MPIETVPVADSRYFLIAFNVDGRERTDDPNGLTSARVVDAATADRITDVFMLSHGWQGDVPTARAQYGGWIGAMATASAGCERMGAVRPDFRALLIGLHWPSLAFGGEALGGPVSFSGPSDSVAAAATGISVLVDQDAARIADTPAARAALRRVFEGASDDPAPPTLPDDVRRAYEVLDGESGTGSGDPGAPPGHDREPFDPEAIHQPAADEVPSFGDFDLFGGLLAPERLLSF